MLETIKLPGSGRTTTRLGFGCSGLMGGLSERESLLLLETAFDAGIRHYDVAPSYGHGQAERCLGKFLRGKTDSVTITTKYGILPARRTNLLGVARTTLRPIARRLPSVKNTLAHAATRLKSKANFSAAEARQSLEHSLRELQLQRIDVLLLHEATANDLDGSDMLPFLQQMQREGIIGTYGVGAEAARLEAVWTAHRQYCPILQYESSAFGPQPRFPGAFVVQHRAIATGLIAVRHSFERDSSLRRNWSDALDADLADNAVLALLLLHAALASNPDGMVLFSSRVPEHVRANALAGGDPVWAARGRRFRELIVRAGRPLV